jgi:hypothetical protein
VDQISVLFLFSFGYKALTVSCTAFAGNLCGVPDLILSRMKVRIMMLLKIKRLGEGLHPSETFVSIETKSGSEQVAVDTKALRNGTLPIGWPVGKDDGYFLVELPRPTANGARRVWVKKEQVVLDKADKAARKTA